ncbi:MAG: DNA translocase FtsK 4TM domain-containing protein [Clostridiales bacterium]|nr:DNA translocase FtsK 4TM domain-containing protein [Clostridiales bacterium]
MANNSTKNSESNTEKNKSKTATEKNHTKKSTTKGAADHTNKNTAKSVTSNTSRNTTKKTGGNARAKSASAKGQTGKAKNKKGTSSPQEEQSRGIPMKNEIQLIASFGIMLILLLSNFGYCGIVGVWLASFFFGIFGCVQYVMPVAFFLMVAVLIANDYSVLAMKKCVAGFVVLMIISAFAQIIYQGEVNEFYNLFAAAVEDHHAGGMIGGGIGLLLKNLFGTPGAMVILFCVLLLALIVLAQRSFVGFFRNCVNTTQSKVKETREKYAQAAKERKEKKEKEKKEKETVSDKIRTKQCEDKLKEMEEKKSDVKKSRKVEAEGEEVEAPEDGISKKEPEIKIHVPVFTSSDEVKPKDSVRELHPEIYPFTAEDGKPKAFEGRLDFTAFSFNSGKTPEEFEEEMEKQKEAVFYAQKEEQKQKEGRKGLPEEIIPSEAYVLDKSAVEEHTVVESHEPESVIEGNLIEEGIMNEQPFAESLAGRAVDADDAAGTGEKLFAKGDAASLKHEGIQAAADRRQVVSGVRKTQEVASADPQAATGESAGRKTRKPGGHEDYFFPPLSLLTSE